MFAVSSVDAARCYYEELNKLQIDAKRPLRIATIFSYTANEEQNAIGEIVDETFEPSAMDNSSKEFLAKAIADYNLMFGTSFGVDSKEFQNYYRDLAKRVKSREIDLVIVVGMFLTGFDAPTLNTLFVDKNLRFHGLIQAYSRTNRIFDSTKTFGNIITFRNLEQNTIDAITLFGDRSTRNVVLEKSFKEYLDGFKDTESGEAKKGFVDIVKDLEEKFPDVSLIETEADKKEFVKLFGEYLRVENILQNYDEFTYLKELQKIDIEDKDALEAFKETHFISEDDLKKMLEIQMLSDRRIQDYKSTYNDIRDWLRIEREGDKPEKSKINWDDVVFEIDLLKSQEINLDYILELIFEHNKKEQDKPSIIEEVRKTIRASVGNRAKESLIVEFINDTDLDSIKDKTDIIEQFIKYAQSKQQEEVNQLIEGENLNEKEAIRFINLSLRREFVSENGTDFNSILPKMSPLNPKYLSLKHIVFEKLAMLVEKFKGIGYENTT